MKIIVNVTPNSSKEYFEHIKDNEYLAHITEKAEDGKANNVLINLLAKKFKVNWKKINIKNPRSRKKTVEIIGM